jgi:hypothetical protein
VAVVHQELGAVFLGGDRVFVRHLHDLERLDRQLIAAREARGALVLFDQAGDDHRRLLRDLAGLLELGFGQVAFEGHALGDAGAVAQLDERQFALAGAVVDPAAQGDLLPVVLGDVCNRDDGWHGVNSCRQVKNAKNRLWAIIARPKSPLLFWSDLTGCAQPQSGV